MKQQRYTHLPACSLWEVNWLDNKVEKGEQVPPLSQSTSFKCSVYTLSVFDKGKERFQPIIVSHFSHSFKPPRIAAQSDPNMEVTWLIRSLMTNERVREYSIPSNMALCYYWPPSRFPPSCPFSLSNLHWKAAVLVMIMKIAAADTKAQCLQTVLLLFNINFPIFQYFACAYFFSIYSKFHIL